MDPLGRLPPVDQPFILRQAWRIGGRRLVLGCFNYIAARQRINGRGEQSGAESCQVALDFLARLVQTDRSADRGEHGA